MIEATDSKRSNQTGRTVIGPDPRIRTTEVIITEKMAKILTVVERVNPFNITYLSNIVNEGKANVVIRQIQDKKTGKMKEIKHIMKYSLYAKGDLVKKTTLQHGDKVLRTTLSLIGP